MVVILDDKSLLVLVASVEEVIFVESLENELEVSLLVGRLDRFYCNWLLLAF
jgi:hypothetical protein